MLKKFSIRLLFVLTVVTLQFAFLNLLFANADYTPNIISLTVVAWTVVKKFRNVWGWVLLLGVLTDVVGGIHLGISAGFLLALSFGVDFLLKRFSVENQLGRVGLLFSFAVTTSLFRKIISFNFFASNYKEMFTFHWQMGSVNWWSFLAEILTILIIFFMIYTVIKRMEKYLDRINDKLKIHI